jgi:hypothetical protein
VCEAEILQVKTDDKSSYHCDSKSVTANLALNLPATVSLLGTFYKSEKFVIIPSSLIFGP